MTTPSPAGLADLVARYVDRLNAGETIDKQAIREAHPEAASRILEELEVFVHSVVHEQASISLADYESIREIGRGGMGVVYRAWQRSMHRQVALKVLPPGLAADSRVVSRFVREAQAAGKLNHPNVVPVHGMGVEGAIPYYAMELVEGVTLAQLLRDAGGQKGSASPGGIEAVVHVLGDREKALGEADPSPDGALERTPARGRAFASLAVAFARVADGLEHAHSRGVIHRDIKPSNLIVDREGKIRILDFGLATIEGHESITMSGDLLGTPLYMSPEQAAGERDRIDRRTDIYSVGATLYEVLTMRPPFQGKDREDIRKRIRELDPADPRQLNSSVPRDLESVVLRCLEKSPARRYGTAEALAQDLLRFARGDPVEAKPISRWERAGRRIRRHWGKLVIVGCLLIAAGGVGSLERNRYLAELDARRAYYRESVLSTLVETFRGQMVLSGQELPSLSFFQAQRYKAPDDTTAALGVSEVVDLLHGIARASPERPEAFYYLARLLLQLGRTEEAIDAATAALRSAPDFVPAEVLQVRIRRGVHRLGQEDLDRIAVRFTGSRRWQEAWLRAYQHYGEKSWKDAAGAFGDLLAHRERAARSDEPYIGCGIEATMGLGISALRGRDFERAVREFSGARRMWPRFREAALLLGKAYALGGRPEEAQRVFDDLYAETAPDAKAEVAEWITRLCLIGLRDAEAAARWVPRVDGWRRHRLQAYIHLFSSDHEAAIEAATTTLHEEPEDLSALLCLAYARLSRQEGRRGERWEAERRDLLRFTRRFIEMYPRSNMANGAHALALLADGRPEDAWIAARRIRTVEAQAGIFTVVLPLVESRIHRSAGRLDEAEHAIRVAIDVRPKHLFSRLELGRVLAAAGRNREACAVFEQLVEDANGWATPRCELARVLLAQGRIDEAIEQAAAATELLPRNSAAWENLSEALLAADRFEEALEAADRGRELLPDRPRIHVVMGDVLAVIGDPREAAASYRSALELDPKRPDAHEALLDLIGRFAGEIERNDLAGLQEALRAKLTTAGDDGARRAMQSTIEAIDVLFDGRER